MRICVQKYQNVDTAETSFFLLRWFLPHTDAEAFVYNYMENSKVNEQ